MVEIRLNSSWRQQLFTLHPNLNAVQPSGKVVFSTSFCWVITWASRIQSRLACPIRLSAPGRYHSLNWILMDFNFTYCSFESLFHVDIIFFPNSNNLKHKKIFVSTQHVKLNYSYGKHNVSILTLSSVTTTYSWDCVLNTAGQVIICPCFTVQLPVGFWSDTY